MQLQSAPFILRSRAFFLRLPTSDHNTFILNLLLGCIKLE